MLIKKQTRNLLVLALVLGAVVIAYWPSLYNGFTSWDDNIHLVENESIRTLSLHSLKTIFTSEVSLVYIPLTSLSFALEYHFFGYNPFVYHLDNLLLHLGVVTLLFVLAMRITSSLTVAAVAALVFGIHPMHVESVAWVTERKDVLYSVFYLLALNSYWTYLNKGRVSSYIATLIFAVLSILSKSMALSLPLVLIMLDWFYGRRFNRKTLLEKIPFFAVLAPIAWITYSLNSRVIIMKFPDALLTWMWTFVFYLKKFIWPFELLPLYELPEPVKVTNPEFLLAAAVFTAIVILLIYFRRNRWLVFAALYYYLSIFFLLRFDHKADLCIVADRFMYLPSLGICLLIGIYLRKFLRWARGEGKEFYIGTVMFIVMCVMFLGGATFNQSKLWGDELSFWDRVIAKYPQSVMAYNQRGLENKKRGNIQNALADYDQAIALFPGYAYAYTNRGIVLKELGRYQEAIEDHTKAILLNPDFSEAFLNRGNVYFQMGDFPKAIENYNRAIQNRGLSARRRVTPYQSEVFSRRGAAHFFAKDYDPALADFNKSLEIDPNNIVALDNRAIIYSLRGKYDLALKDFERSLKLVPRNPVSYANRALLFHMMGNDEDALSDLNMAIFIKPDYERAVNLKAEIEKKR